jgi:hypothetical protein
VKLRHVSAYLKDIFRFTKCWLIETNVGPVWLDVEMSSSAQYSEGYNNMCIKGTDIHMCVKLQKKQITSLTALLLTLISTNTMGMPQLKTISWSFISRHVVGLFWVPGHAGVRGNEIAYRLTRSGSGQRFTGSEPFLGVSRQNIRRKIKNWIEKQYLALWRGPCGTQRQARELISGPNLAIGARLLSFNRTQSRAVIGLLTGQNTLKRHLHVMGLSNDPTCRKCGTLERGSCNLVPNEGHKEPVLRPMCIGPEPKYYSILFLVIYFTAFLLDISNSQVNFLLTV